MAKKKVKEVTVIEPLEKEVIEPVEEITTETKEEKTPELGVVVAEPVNEEDDEKENTDEDISNQKTIPGFVGSVVEQVQGPIVVDTLEDSNESSAGEEIDKGEPEEESPTMDKPLEDVAEEPGPELEGEVMGAEDEEVEEETVVNPSTKPYKHKYQGRKEPLLLSGSVLEFIYFLFDEGVHIVSFIEGLTKDNLEFLKAAEVKTSKGKSIKLEYNDEKGYIFEEVE